MSREEFALQLERLATDLERAVPLASTRAEHIRVSAAALQARALARVFAERAAA